MSESTDEVSAELEILDQMERRLLEMDHALDSGGNNRDLIHSLFRSAHNLKSAVALRGDVGATGLVHQMESALDSMRSGLHSPTRALLDALLESTDLLRNGVAGVGDDHRAFAGLAQVIERESARPMRAAARSRDAVEAVGFALSEEEEGRLGAELSSGSRAYVAEKLLDGSLSPERLAALPVFDAIAGIGRIIATRPSPDDVPRGRETLLSILFATGVAAEELFLTVFDPCREVRLDLSDREARQARSPSNAEADARPPAPDRPDPSRERRNLRVDTEKLDKLFDLVGELITAEAMLKNSPDLKGLDLPALMKSFASVAKITRELQETTMSIRMVPLEGLFGRVARLVRDLSRKVGKKVELDVSGGDVEMDKNVIELLADPLAHLIRNSIDHGLEGGDGRRAAGKAEVGKVSLGARQEGSDILITVADDGAGLDREAILRKARETGLVEGEGAALADEAVWDFIFRPGFSTSREVTDISGRGVGLDVVRKNLERVRGSVGVSTQAGRGTAFTLRIPLTLAIIDAVTVRAGNCSYSIPVADIREFFKPKQDRIARAGGEIVALRQEFLPLIRLDEALSPFGPAPGARGAAEGVVLVVAQDGRKACLLIDEVLGAQQMVIKPLPPYLGEIAGLSGCSIDGDGRVSFIVDTGRLIARRVE